jgi:hypothetical protein
MWLFSQLVSPPQSFERSIWDHVGFYTIHTFLGPSVESQFRIISKSYNCLFGTTTTQSVTFFTSHFFSGQSRHASSSSIVLYLWLGARRPTAQLYNSGMVSQEPTLGDPCVIGETLPPRTSNKKLNSRSAVSTTPTMSQHPLEKQVTSSQELQSTRKFLQMHLQEPDFFLFHE